MRSPSPEVEDADTDSDSDPTPTRRGRSTRSRAQNWTRLAHVYTSMVCFVVVLFFSITGLTLNHPSWKLGDGSTATAEGVLPAGSLGNGEVDWLAVAEYLRTEHSLRGKVADHEVTGTDGSISFKGAGFGADVFFDAETGVYDITVESQDALAVINDLHKGRNTNTSWGWLIDLSAVLLIVISASGLILQLFLRKRRRAAMVTAAVGAVLTVLLIWWALR